MEKFTFSVGQISTIWEDGQVQIEAETYEEAKEKVIALLEDGLVDINNLVEPDLQTIESMDPSQYGGSPTQFLYGTEPGAEDDYMLWDNATNNQPTGDDDDNGRKNGCDVEAALVR